MNPTAEDILNKYRRMGWSHEYAENGILSFDDAKKALEEYSLLKSKEAASEAWDEAECFPSDKANLQKTLL